jgi:hypothetical protein
MLLHEESYRPAETGAVSRLSRHYYDLWCLIRHGVALRAAADLELFRKVAEHREMFFRWSWMDYTTLRPGLLRIAPSPIQVSRWQADYDAMRREMFHGEVPVFGEVIRVISEFEREFNQSAGAVPE